MLILTKFELGLLKTQALTIETNLRVNTTIEIEFLLCKSL